MSDMSAVDPRHEALKLVSEITVASSMDRNANRALVLAVIYLADVLAGKAKERTDDA